MRNYMVQIVRDRYKSIRLEIADEAMVIVRCPKEVPRAEIMKILDEKSDWIDRHLKKMADRKYGKVPERKPDKKPEREPEKSPASGNGKFTEAQLQRLKIQAKQVIPKRVAYYAKQVGVTYGRIAIRSQKTRWGSCSSKGNLNFNCLLMLTPPEVLDYVVVHELCHRKEMNHSKAFWAEVAKVLPDYKKQKNWLKEHGGKLIVRL